MTACNQSSMHKCPVLPPTLSAPSNTWTLAFSFRSCSSFSVVDSAINLTDFIAPSLPSPPPPQHAIEAGKIIWIGGGEGVKKVRVFVISHLFAPFPFGSRPRHISKVTNVTEYLFK